MSRSQKMIFLVFGPPLVLFMLTDLCTALSGQALPAIITLPLVTAHVFVVRRAMRRACAHDNNITVKLVAIKR